MVVCIKKNQPLFCEAYVYKRCLDINCEHGTKLCSNPYGKYHITRETADHLAKRMKVNKVPITVDHKSDVDSVGEVLSVKSTDIGLHVIFTINRQGFLTAMYKVFQSYKRTKPDVKYTHLFKNAFSSVSLS